MEEEEGKKKKKRQMEETFMISLPLIQNKLKMWETVYAPFLTCRVHSGIFSPSTTSQTACSKEISFTL